MLDAFSDDFFTAPEIAKRLKVNPDTVRTWTKAGHPIAGVLPSTDTGKATRSRLRIWGPDVNDFLRRTIVAPAPRQPRRTRRTAK